MNLRQPFSWERFARAAVGRKSDWIPRIPSHSAIAPRLKWLGPAVMTASVLVPWVAFSGASGDEGSVALGLFVGAASVTLMAWSFLLAVRIRPLEPFFGGLDSMYKAHRWAGVLSVVAMFLHTQMEPEIDGGVLGASKSVADSARSLAGTGQYLLYALVAISMLRWFPYRYWRWTHKLLVVPFGFASWHFFTAEKPYANSSGWGWYFGIVMVSGLVAYVVRVIGRDAVVRGVPYTVASTHTVNRTTMIELAPRGRKLIHRAGEFAVLKLDVDGLKEPHVFTIASSPSASNLRFYVRDLGDWTAKIQNADLVGADARIEGPFGEFEPLPHSAGSSVLWIAGGVGITPFLSAIDSLPVGEAEAPKLLYCVRVAADATAIDELRAANDDGRIRLHIFESGSGSRFTADGLAGVVLGEASAGDQLLDTHVAICGPTSLVADAAAAARGLGARRIETEGFDIRGGFGPDLSREIEALLN